MQQQNTNNNWKIALFLACALAMGAWGQIACSGDDSDSSGGDGDADGDSDGDADGDADGAFPEFRPELGESCRQ